MTCVYCDRDDTHCVGWDDPTVGGKGHVLLVCSRHVGMAMRQAYDDGADFTRTFSVRRGRTIHPSA